MQIKMLKWILYRNVKIVFKNILMLWPKPNYWLTAPEFWISLCCTIASLHFSKLETNTFFSVTNNSSHMKATVGLAMSISCGGASVGCFPRAENCWCLTHRCLCSAAAELTAGNAVRMREFPSQHKEAPVCCGSADNERSGACVCAVLILEAAVDALSHKNDSSET